MGDRHYHLGDVLQEEYRALRPAASPAPDSALDIPATDDAEACLRLAAIQQRMLQDTDGLNALCLSGGGIRSATFTLGVIQGLAKRSLLERFDYLSTVSGGGYMGAWLSAWAQRHPQGIAGVSAELRGPQVPGSPAEPEPVHQLREYSNYLAPRFGALSIDTWTLIATYLRNLTLNWLVILPLLCAMLLVPRLYAALLVTPIHPMALLLVGSIVAGLMWMGLRYVGMDRPSAGGMNRDQGEFLRSCLLPLGASVLLISLGWVWIHRADTPLPHGLIDWPVIIGVSTLVYLGAWSRHLWHIDLREGRWRHKLREGMAALVSGSVAGVLVWVWTQLFDAKLETPQSVALYTCFAAPSLWLVFTLAETVFIGLSSRQTGEDDREWWARSGAWILVAMSGWVVLSLTVIYGPELLLWSWRELAGIGGLTGILTFWAARNSTNKQRTTPTDAETGGKNTDWNIRIAQLVLGVTAPLSVLAVLILLAYLTDWIFGLRATSDSGSHLQLVFTTDSLSSLCFIGIALLISVTMARFINVNRFSLHAMYRNRLIRAYLGASRRKANADVTDCGTLHPFTGFDEDDNLQLHELWPGAASKKDPVRRTPFLVVNIALNLVKSECLAWQQRKAAAFSVTPLHAGGCCVGYRRVNEYGGDNGISLGTAMTISGAAASPNMGYQTTSSLAFLMGLFNARLGWWLGNPANDETWRKPGPDFSVAPLINEMFGLTSEKSPWVYLSDGGHFDNLGLYEMVQRRCRLIVVCDAGADPCGNFEDLGNAIRKIRADFGITIEMESSSIGIGSRGHVQTDGHYCALFRVDYCTDQPGGSPKTGQILYIKPAFYGGEPMDIFNYARENPAFPHEPTRDQFFSESQFESYRHLGEYIVDKLVADSKEPVTTLEDFVAAGRSHCGLDV